MGILSTFKKIFGLGKPRDRREKRLHFRYIIPEGFLAYVKITDVINPDGTGESLDVRAELKDLNIEALSIRVYCDHCKRRFKPGQSLNVKVNIEGESRDFKTKILRMEKELVVLGFEKCLPDDLKWLMRNCPRLIGLSLKEIKLGEPSGQLSCRWFHGQNYTDLFVWSMPGAKVDTEGLDRIHFVFEDNVLDWDRKGKIRTGMMKHKVFFNSLEDAKKPVSDVKVHQEPSHRTIARAKSVIQNSEIDEDVKDCLIALFSGS